MVLVPPGRRTDLALLPAMMWVINQWRYNELWQQWCEASVWLAPRQGLRPKKTWDSARNAFWMHILIHITRGKLKRVSRTTNELSRITTSAVQSTSNFDKDMWSLAQHRDILIPRFTPTTTTTALMDHKLHCAALSNMLPCSTQAFGSPAPLVPGAGPTPSTKILQGLIKLALSNLFDIWSPAADRFLHFDSPVRKSKRVILSGYACQPYRRGWLAATKVGLQTTCVVTWKLDKVAQSVH